MKATRDSLYFSLSVLTSATLCLSLFLFLNNNEEKKLDLAFKFYSKSLISRIEAKLEYISSAINSYQAFYDASKQVDPDEFETFTNSLTFNLGEISEIKLIKNQLAANLKKNKFSDDGCYLYSKPIYKQGTFVGNIQAKIDFKTLVDNVYADFDRESIHLLMLTNYNNQLHTFFQSHESDVQEKDFKSVLDLTYMLKGSVSNTFLWENNNILFFVAKPGADFYSNNVFVPPYVLPALVFALLMVLLVSLRNEANKTIEINKIVEKRTLELMESNKELEKFAFIASHDLQEPLRTVGGYLDILISKYFTNSDLLDDKAHKYIDGIASSLERMRQLIKDLLDYSRLNKASNFQKFDLSYLIKSISQDLEVSITENNVKIIAPEQSYFICADESLMRQLFQNLITNSIKFKSKDPPIILIEPSENDDFWFFRFIDNGIGIDAKYFDKIFEIFQRLHLKEEFKGNGIGLSVCKKIIDIHGGVITIESEVGKGTIFRFSISKHLKNKA